MKFSIILLTLIFLAYSPLSRATCVRDLLQIYADRQLSLSETLQVHRIMSGNTYINKTNIMQFLNNLRVSREMFEKFLEGTSPNTLGAVGFILEDFNNFEDLQLKLNSINREDIPLEAKFPKISEMIWKMASYGGYNTSKPN